jgi:hypothetical protein
MEPGTKRRSSRSEAAQTWWGSLSTLPPAQRPSRLLATTLVLAGATAGAAMPLVWHHLDVPSPTFSGPLVREVLDGLSAASWLIGVAAITLALALRLYRHPPGSGMKVTIAVLAFLTVNGMFIDYFDWSRRGVSLQSPAFYGPGFFVGLGCAALLVFAAVFGWRLREASA